MQQYPGGRGKSVIQERFKCSRRHANGGQYPHRNVTPWAFKSKTCLMIIILFTEGERVRVGEVKPLVGFLGKEGGEEEETWAGLRFERMPPCRPRIETYSSRNLLSRKEKEGLRISCLRSSN
jgi:hypothetical protein